MEKGLLRLYLNKHGFSPEVIEKLIDAGFDDIKKLKKTRIRKLMRVIGIDKKTAKRLKKTLLKMRTEPQPKEAEIFICTSCGAFVSSSAGRRARTSDTTAGRPAGDSPGAKGCPEVRD